MCQMCVMSKEKHCSKWDSLKSDSQQRTQFGAWDSKAESMGNRTVAWVMGCRFEMTATRGSKGKPNYNCCSQQVLFQMPGLHNHSNPDHEHLLFTEKFNFSIKWKTNLKQG